MGKKVRPSMYIISNQAQFTLPYNCRICPGRHFADATVWILIASLLSAFKFSKAVDKDGNEIDVEYAKELPDTLVLR